MALPERDLIERLPIAAFVIDSEHRVVHWNRACVELTGLAAAEMLGTRDQWKAFYPHERPLLCDLLVRGATDREVEAHYRDKPRRSTLSGALEGEDFFPRLPNGGRWLFFTAAPIEAADGRLAGAIQVCVDITERKRTAAERLATQRLLTEIIEGNPVPTFVIDAEHRVTHWNRACDVVMGMPAEAMIGTREQWRAFYPKARPVMADLILDQAQQSELEQYYENVNASPFIAGAYEAEDFFPHFPGGGRWLFFTAAPLRSLDGEIIGAIETLQDTTERKRAEIAHAQSERLLAEEKYKTLFNEMINGFALHEIILDDDGHPVDYRFLGVNPAFEEMTGLRAGDIVGRRVLELMPRTEAAWIERYGRVALTGEPDTFESYSAEIDKSFEVRAFRPSPGQFAVTFQDVTARKRAEARLNLLARVFEHTQEGILVTDPDGVIIEVNDAFLHLTGYERADLIGQTPRVLKSGRHGPEFYAAMWRALQEDGLWRGEIWNRRKDGEIVPEQMTISVLLDQAGRPSHYVGVVVDITAMKRHQAELDRIAHYDALTGLANRVLLKDRLEQAIAKAQRDRRLLAVCFLDVDGFKPVNDTHGHGAGDHLLVELAERFRHELRAHDTVARLGGDEFIILLTDLEDQGTCIRTLQRILATVNRPFIISGHVVSVTASIGVTLYPIRATDTDTLMRQADQAMYRSKQMGKNRFFFYEGHEDILAVEGRKLINRLGCALCENEFVLHYQPQVNMRTGRLVGAEALLRWRHPERGLLSPGDFLPPLEDNDLIVALGEWILREALRQLDAWERDGLCVPISVNIAARQLQGASFVERLEEGLRQAGRLGAGGLEIEITETTAINDLRHIGELIESCRALGVRAALDDFGTGYSSLTSLRQLPVQTLKIDRSFISDMAVDGGDHAIVSAVIGLARAFDRTVIAEGVETTDQGMRLLALGCELAQGGAIAAPMTPERFRAWARTWQPDPAWTQAEVPVCDH